MDNFFKCAYCGKGIDEHELANAVATKTRDKESKRYVFHGPFHEQCGPLWLRDYDRTDKQTCR